MEGLNGGGISQSHMWRVSLVQRVAWIVVSCVLLALALVVTIGGNRTPGAGDSPTVLLWIVTIVIALGGWRYAFLPYIEATEGDLVVRNAFSTKRFHWSDIKTITPGSMGLVIVTGDDRLIPSHAWAVQKGRGARWTGTRCRADAVTQALMDRVRAAAP
jgi:hypothetical protein